MMTPVSLIIVSRNRPDLLGRVLRSLWYQTHPNFELIVVSDQPDLSQFSDQIGGRAVKHAHFSEPNISAARNLGISLAAGDILAFIDDDAVPEPMWLERLAAAFDIPEVGIAGGYVRGRNGISWQWRALACDLAGEDATISEPEDEIAVYPPTPDRFVRVQGTNCAFRRDAVLEQGGFDENFRFFLDETDLTLRLAQAGWATALVPLAEVQHGFAESDQRSRFRVPKTLADIGASKAYFLAKHSAPAPDALTRMEAEQRARLIGWMVSGHIEPRDLRRLLATLRDGFKNPPTGGPVNTYLTRTGTPSFQRFDVIDTLKCSGLFGNVLLFPLLRRAAGRLAAEGHVVTLFRYSLTMLFHRRYFDRRGYWVQAGGLFGRSDRDEPLFQLRLSPVRTRREARKLARQRPDMKTAYWAAASKLLHK